MQMKTKTIYFWLGFTSASAAVLSLLLAILPGHTERGSGRRDFTETLVAEAQGDSTETLFAEAPQGETKGDREPEHGKRKD